MAGRAKLEEVLRFLLNDEASPIREANTFLKDGASFRFSTQGFAGVRVKLHGRFREAPEGDFVPHIDFQVPEVEDFLALRQITDPRAFGQRIQELQGAGRLHIQVLHPFIESWDIGLGPWLQTIGILTPPRDYPDLIRSLKLKDIAFTEILDVNYIQELVDELARIVDIRLWVLDMDSIPIAVSSTGGEHCRLIINSLEGVQRCYCSAIEGIAELKKSLTPRVRKCHAGFICMDAPLILNGEMVGIITGDASLPESPEPEVYRALAKELEIDAEQLVKSLSKVRRLNLDEIEFILSVVNAMGQVVTEMSFNQYMLAEKVKELSGLNRISSLLSNHLSSDLDGVYGRVAEEIAALKQGMHCELELNLGGRRRTFASSNGREGDGKETEALCIEIKDGKRKQGKIYLDRPGGLDNVPAGDDHFLESVGSQISMALQNSQLYEELKRKNRDLRKLLRALNEVQEKERASIARDLHDDTGQQLTNALLNLEMALAETRSTAKNRRHLDSAVASITAVLEQLHDISVRLHPPVLDDLGLTEALGNLLRRMNSEYPISFRMEVHGQEAELSAEMQLNMYRIVQEALSNIVKHSEAREAVVHFTYHDGGIDLLVSDNGKGCGKNAGTCEDHVHLGLVNMRERSEQMGGSFHFMTGPSGTTVAVHIPSGHGGGAGEAAGTSGKVSGPL